MRSNAGMADRQGDVDLRFALVSAPHLELLLGLAWLYREITAVCSHIHTKHINTLCGQNVEFVRVKLAVHVATTGL